MSKSLHIPESTEPLHRVFVYGTLLAGESNHHRFLSTARMIETNHEPFLKDDGWKMVSLGGFPALVPGTPRASIMGEVYEVTATQLAALDYLEGVRVGGGGLYERKELDTSIGPAWTYVMPELRYERNAPEIHSGNWRQYRKDLAGAHR